MLFMLAPQILGAGGEGFHMNDEIPGVIGRMILKNLFWDRNAGAYCWHPQSTICKPSICLNRFSVVIPPLPQPLSPKFQASSTCMEFGGEGSQRAGKSVSYIRVETNALRESRTHRPGEGGITLESVSIANHSLNK